MGRDSDLKTLTFVDLPEVKSDKNAMYESIVHSLPKPMQGIGGQTQLQGLWEKP
jgi:hypothetical protein